MKKGIDWEGRIGRRLRLRDLHVLLAVVQSGSMAKAAVALGVSQPVVSEAIADLEAAIGVRLVDRSRRGVTPTLYGEAILARSKVVFDELRQGIRDIEFLAEPALGEVRIGCPESLAIGVLPPIIDAFSRRYPHVRFQVAQVNTLNPRLEFPELRERRLDVVLARVVATPGEIDVADDLGVEHLIDDHLLVAAGASSPWAARRKIGLAELADAPWILPANSWNSRRVEEAFAAIGVKMPEVIVDTFSVVLRNQLLATGRFVTAMPASTYNTQARDAHLKVLPLALPDKPWPVVMVTLKERTLSPAANHFIACARAVTRRAAEPPKTRSLADRVQRE
jgi:DNA-binding transcriptional LysR family regulator